VAKLTLNKERQGLHCSINTTRCYADSLEFYNELFRVAKEDFPELTEDDCTLSKCSGKGYDRMAVIKFQVKKSWPVSEEYREVVEFVPTYY